MEVSCQNLCVKEFQMRLQNYFHPHFLLLLRTQLVFPAHLFLVASKRVWENWQAGGSPLFLSLFFKYSCKLYFLNLGLKTDYTLNLFYQQWSNKNEFTLPDLLNNVAWHESNQFGGKKMTQRWPGWDSNSRPSN